MRMFKPLQSALLLIVGLVAGAAAHADSAPAYTLGQQYTVARTVAQPADPKRVTVEEFFWYGCPHCYHIEPDVSTWLQHKPADVDFVRVPCTLGRDAGIVHQRAFYVAKELGVLDRLHKPLFDAIQAEPGNMSDMDSIRSFFARNGVDPKQFDSIATSFVIDTDMRSADELAMDYGVSGTPTFIVGGKYTVSAQADVTKVIDFVIDKVRKERGLK
jgi:thiol:disulfide interchange protein DsbA